jgi:hypothetical protein
MTTSYTINSKVFNKTKSPSATSTVLTTRSRGDTLPDVLTVSHKETKNAVEPGSNDTRSLVRIDRTYDSGSGVMKTVSWMLNSVIPDDADATNIAAALADLTDFMASAITLRTANIAVITNHEVA